MSESLLKAIAVFTFGMIAGVLVCVTGCADDVPAEVDAGLAEIDAVSPDVRPLDPCTPLINQFLIPWAELGIPEGTCVKLRCPEGGGSWSLMICHKTGGGAEVYWEIVQ